MFYMRGMLPVAVRFGPAVIFIAQVTLNEFIDGGICLEMIDDGGFSGTLRITDGAAENTVEYVRLSAGFGMNATEPDTIEVIDTGIAFDKKNDKTDKYYIAEMAQALLDGLRAYHP